MIGAATRPAASTLRPPDRSTTDPVGQHDRHAATEARCHDHPPPGKTPPVGRTNGREDTSNEGLEVMNPRMWPWFRTGLDRRLNRALLRRQLTPALSNQPGPVTALTTIPIVADLVGVLPVARWVYYCVDDFGQWPGLDGAVLIRMERQLIATADVLIAAGDHLRNRLVGMGREVHLLTHGVDLEHWAGCADVPVWPELEGLPRPLVVFWGLIDRRMDVPSLARLSADLAGGTIVLVGPEQDPDPALNHVPRLVRPPAVPYEQLAGPGPRGRGADHALRRPAGDPGDAAAEAQGIPGDGAAGGGRRPARQPRPWADCLDLAGSPGAFSAAVRERIATGLPADQRAARSRLAAEGWAAKAEAFERWIAGIAGSGRAGDADGPERMPVAAGDLSPVVLDARVVTGSGGGPDKTILNSPRFLAADRLPDALRLHAPARRPGLRAAPAPGRGLGGPLLSVPDRGPLGLAGRPPIAGDLPPRAGRRSGTATTTRATCSACCCGRSGRCGWSRPSTAGSSGPGRTPLTTPSTGSACRATSGSSASRRTSATRCLAAGVPAASAACWSRTASTPEQFTRRFDRRGGQAAARHRRRIGSSSGPSAGSPAEKGFDVLIRAADRLLAAGRDLELLIAGEGDERPALEALIAELGRGDRIRLLGFRRTTVRPLFEAMDAFALSSLREGLPNVLLEAMALEVPVVATRIAGVPRLVRARGERPARRAGLGRRRWPRPSAGCCADPACGDRLGRAGRATIEAEYSFAARMETIRDLYDDLLSGRPGARPPGEQPP